MSTQRVDLFVAMQPLEVANGPSIDALGLSPRLVPRIMVISHIHRRPQSAGTLVHVSKNPLLADAAVTSDHSLVVQLHMSGEP